jgi:hypothetical protein
VKERVERESLRKQIFEATEGLAFARDIVVTIVPDECVDRNDKSKPFLRIIGYLPRRMDQLIPCLVALRMDMETPAEFIPGEEH